MLKEQFKKRVDENKCLICGEEFTKQYLKDNEVVEIFDKGFGKRIKVCRKHHNFFREL